jgi:short subunit dehydrogenase-like uncharacterized protein
MAPPFVIYGANGFTGRLIAERARERGLQPVLAGRTRDAVEGLGAQLGLEARVFDLSNPEVVDGGIRDARLVLHCAGPFSQTSRPMVDACLRTGVSYLDITGEYAVLEAALGRDAEARAARMVLLPAVGFDVVPTDCLAAKLHAELPDATRLELAFSGGTPSPGTAKTVIEGLHVWALIRENGQIVRLRRPRTRHVPFARGSRFVMSIPAGDLVTAFSSTGIPNITVYTVVPRSAALLAPLLSVGGSLLKRPGVVRFLQNRAEQRAKGPTDEQRKTAKISVWGHVVNTYGATKEGQLEVPEGYEFTVLAALACVERVLRGDVPPGATTPSKAFGPDFVTTLPGVGPFLLRK